MLKVPTEAKNDDSFSISLQSVQLGPFVTAPKRAADPSCAYGAVEYGHAAILCDEYL